jgi:hypothetical protein
LDIHAPEARDAARRKLAAPAMSLVLVGIIDAALSVMGLLANLLGIGLTFLEGRAPEEAPWFLWRVGGVAWCVAGIGLSGFVIWAALGMRRLQSYPMAFAACVIALVPCMSPCCVLGIPFGIWGLFVMHDDDVRPHFPS